MSPKRHKQQDDEAKSRERLLYSICSFYFAEVLNEGGVSPPNEEPRASLNKMRKQYWDPSRQRALAARRALLDAYKLDRGCVDCGYNLYAEALDFDHVSGAKTFQVSNSMTNSLPRLMAEIEKCDVVCANCHRVRTRDRKRKAE